MKIIHVIFGLTYGGIETMLVQIVNEQINMAQVTILLVNDFYDQSLIDKIDPRVNLIRLNRPLKSKNPFYLFKLNFYLALLTPDIIHLQSLSIIRYILPIYRKKTVGTIHDTPSSTHFKAIHFCPCIFAISQSVQKDLMKHGYQSKLIENGIPVHCFAQKEYSTSNNIFRIVQIGRLVHQKKGQDILIEAGLELKHRNVKGFHIDFIGEGESKNYLESLVRKYHLQDYITFLGKKDSTYIETHLKDYDLLVQPSRIEGFGLTVAEAMAAKVPVLVSGQEGPMEIINRGEFGYYFSLENPIELADKILLIKHTDPTILQRLTDNAFERVSACYNVRNTAINYLKNY